MRRTPSLALAALAVIVAATMNAGTPRSVVHAQGAKPGVPQYELEMSWPPQLPNSWVMGVPTWVAVGRDDHIYILHRPSTVPKEQRSNAAPAVIELDNSGKFVRAWGAPGTGFDWPDTEHGLFVDHQDNVWITGINPRAGGDSKRNDDMILKFTRQGKFLFQVGGRNVSGGNKDPKNPHQSAEVFVYQKTNEAFVADGYGNRRVWVIDANTGAFKRQWGAFGKEPLDAPPAPAAGAGQAGGAGAAPAAPTDVAGPGPDQYGIVHGTKVSNDGFVYVADRGNRRIQVFTLDGKYMTQAFVNRTTSNASCGTVVFSQDREQRYVFCPDFNKGEVAILDRKSLETIGAFGSRGAGPGQFQNLHSIAIDSKGNLYGPEVAPGRRLQKFTYKGIK